MTELVPTSEQIDNQMKQLFIDLAAELTPLVVLKENPSPSELFSIAKRLFPDKPEEEIWARVNNIQSGTYEEAEAFYPVDNSRVRILRRPTGEAYYPLEVIVIEDYEMGDMRLTFLKKYEVDEASAEFHQHAELTDIKGNPIDISLEEVLTGAESFEARRKFQLMEQENQLPDARIFTKSRFNEIMALLHRIDPNNINRLDENLWV